MSPKVTEKLINPIVSSGEPSAALRDITDGGIGLIMASYNVGWCFKNKSEMHEMALAVSIVKSETARDHCYYQEHDFAVKKKRDKDGFLRDNDELNHDLFPLILR